MRDGREGSGMCDSRWGRREPRDVMLVASRSLIQAGLKRSIHIYARAEVSDST